MRAALLLTGTLAAAATAFLADVRIRRAEQSPTDAWARIPVAARGLTTLGISFRPLQAQALGLDPRTSLRTLLRYGFDVVRLAAYWDRIERRPGNFDFSDLDWQVDAAIAASKQIVLCVGAVKNFGYPEYFVPRHHLDRPIPEHTLVGPWSHPALLDAATEFIRHVVERYRDTRAVVAWQVEHEAVDPLGLEHSWRLTTAFLEEEIAAVRAADEDRPVLLNGFLASSLPVGAQQQWRTRGQGDSLAVAATHADIVGVDYYPRHAVLGIGSIRAYLDGHASPWPRRRMLRVLKGSRIHGQRVFITEGQAEPWETATTPPSPRASQMSSCLPEHVIQNYNRCMHLAAPARTPLGAYLFWGAEYWLCRERSGDPRYLRAFERVLDDA
jgi:hypothetical protein